MAFLRWLRIRIFKVPEGAIGPKIITWLYWLLHPLNGFYQNQSGVHYDPGYDTYTIMGVKLTGEFILMLKHELETNGRLPQYKGYIKAQENKNLEKQN